MPYWSAVLAAALILWMALAGNSLLNDADTYWHVAAGQWMLEHAQIPDVDPFSHTLAGEPWYAHEWLAEVVLAALHDLAGWMGVLLITLLCIIVTFVWLLRYLLRHLPPLYALLLTVLAIMLASHHLLARPHMLAMPLLVLWCCELAAARDEARRPSLWLLPIMVLWANLHGGFTVGLGIAALFGLEALLDASAAERGRVLRSWLGFGLSAGLASLLTPHGIMGPLFTLHLFSDPDAMRFIAEWQPPDLTEPHPLWLWFSVVLLLLLWKRPRPGVARWLLLAILVALALRYARNTELLGIVGAVLLAAPLGSRFRGQRVVDASAAPDSGVDALFLRLARPMPAAMLSLSVVLLLAAAVVVLGISDHQPGAEHTPESALAYAQQGNVAGPVFNYYDFGGYLIYRGVAPFIDGRADMYGGEFCRRYLEVVLGRASSADTDALLTEHAVEWTLLPPHTSLIEWLDANPEWQRRYSDEVAVIHQRVRG